MSERSPDDVPRDGDIAPGAVTPDLPADLAAEFGGRDVTVLESAMATGEDDGTPGERGPVDPADEAARPAGGTAGPPGGGGPVAPADEAAVAVADDAPLLSDRGGSQGDGLE